MPAPTPSRMTSPGYGFENATRRPGERFPWSRVEVVLASARNYWISSAAPDGRLHAAPVWAIWLDGLLYFSTGELSRKAQNLARNPAVAVHVEGPQREAVIIEGKAEPINDASLLRPVWDAYQAKYSWNAESYPFYVVRPLVAYSFEEQLGDTATRWLFPKQRTDSASLLERGVPALGDLAAQHHYVTSKLVS
jgi:general stress protein 26